MTRFFLTSTLILTFTFLISCNSNEIGDGKDVNPESIYFDYKIWGEEGNEDITVMLQYRFAGKGGTTLFLEEPAKVELDGVEIEVDSSNMTGAYYEVLKPVSEFAGKHTIEFTNYNGEKYAEQFNFHPISLKKAIPHEISRGDIVFELNGLDTLDLVRVVMIDTAFESMDINRIDTARNGKLVIKKERLDKVLNGPIYLELYKEVERPVKEGTDEGGKISITYGLKREFILRD
jgi:hypothetical protein